MDRASHLADVLEQHHPAAAATLSALGRRLFFPQGIPAQSAEARGTRINATIGQITDGHGKPLALPSMLSCLGDLDPGEATLYAAQGGRSDLREAWRDHVRADDPGCGSRVSLPVATGGLTHALSMVADLFAGPGRPVLLPAPCWGNYRAIFGTRRQAPLIPWNLLRSTRGPDGWLDLDSLRDAVGSLEQPALLLLNFPSNPTGYSPTAAEVDGIVDIVAHSPVPLAVLTDDAYQGMWWEPDCYAHSLFHRLSLLPPDRVLAIKVDGATKEFLYFGGRVGFLTFGCEGPAADALDDKARGIARSVISSVSATAQVLVLHMLRDPGIRAQQDDVRERLRARYEALKAAIDRHGLRALPFNSGMFALLAVDGDAEALRLALLAEGLGVVAFAESSALRLSYGSVDRDDIDELVAGIARLARR
ncbi:MAG: aminotransferase class I/II-fold pyridoxal phosphate-dependent enzyme [Alphaproteobacteria bacterium]|nr:aminotransferase class I/II-fold pyridoxal phosphate-dependent enzyme [Alphaproteobacteria bacterium]